MFTHSNILIELLHLLYNILKCDKPLIKLTTHSIF